MNRVPGLSGSSDLLSKYARLEEELGDGDGGNFISGWQCINPWKQTIERSINRQRKELATSEYLYADRFPAVESAFKAFHRDRGEILPGRLIFGPGSTSLLFLLASWLPLRGVTEVFYLTPMYFTLHSAFEILRIRARPINARQPYEREFSINLPQTRCVLVITDPIWYSGTRIPVSVIERIREWQRQTGSTVLVDGSFQYMNWFSKAPEPTSALESELTCRVICPTKQLVMHSYRASYVLVPEANYRELLTLHSHLFGSLSADTMAFLLAATDLFAEGYGHRLMNLASQRHEVLRRSGRTSAAWEPNCGYFCFERANGMPAGTLVMDGSYFQQRRYPDHCRINLLSPQLRLLSPHVDLGPSVKVDHLPA